MPRETKILFRQDTASNWSTQNPTLDTGEIGYVTSGSDTWGAAKTFKIGDGSSPWKSLTNYFSPGAAIASGKTLTVNNTLTFGGTDASSIAFGAGGTVAYLGTAQTFTATQTFYPPTGTAIPMVIRSNGSHDSTQWYASDGVTKVASVGVAGTGTFNGGLSVVNDSTFDGLINPRKINLDYWTVIGAWSSSPYLTVPASASSSGGGNVGIEVVTTANNGNSKYAAVFSSGSYGIGGSIRVNVSGTSPSVDYLQTSDYRLKNNIKPISTGVETILALNPREFNWNGSTTTAHGFIAHELQEILPEAVTGEKDDVNENGDPEYQMIDQGKIIPFLVSALQDALKRIEILEAK